MPTRPATLRREKVGSFSAWAIRLARKVSPKERSSLMVWCEYFTAELFRQAGGVIQCSERCSTYLCYDGQIGRSNYDSHSITGGMRVAF